MRCRHCGAAVRHDSGFCPECGAQVKRRQKGAIRCRHCGRRVSAAGRLCPACGAELRRSWRSVVSVALALLAVAAGYYVVTQVVTVARIRRQVARLPRVSLSALLPQATPTFTPIPTQPTETRPTPTHIPTATRVLSPTPSPSATATATWSPVPTVRRATSTPAFAYPAIQLLSPISGTEFAGDTVVLAWQAESALAADEWYAVSLRYWADGQARSEGALVRETSWQVPATLRAKQDPARPALEWEVQVVRRSPGDSGIGGDDLALSPPSETRTFVWR